MTRAEYERAVYCAHALRLAAGQLAAAVDLDQVLVEIERADALGPVVDPSAWMHRGDAMREDAETVRAVRALARLGMPSAGRRVDVPAPREGGDDGER